VGPVTFSIPEGLTNEAAARTLAGYLADMLYEGDQDLKEKELRSYPRKKYPQNGSRWQLSENNDFWFREENGIGTLTCRCTSQEEILFTIKARFEEKFPAGRSSTLAS
jgi:hypothetical protein